MVVAAAEQVAAVSVEVVEGAAHLDWAPVAGTLAPDLLAVVVGEGTSHAAASGGMVEVDTAALATKPSDLLPPWSSSRSLRRSPSSLV